jgi:hypothetical protein
MSNDKRTDDFEVTVLGGYRTRLPNGQYLVYSGSDDEGREYTVRGSTTTHGPIVEIIGHRNSSETTRRDR